MKKIKLRAVIEYQIYVPDKWDIQDIIFNFEYSCTGTHLNKKIQCDCMGVELTKSLKLSPHI